MKFCTILIFFITFYLVGCTSSPPINNTPATPVSTPAVSTQPLVQKKVSEPIEKDTFQYDTLFYPRTIAQPKIHLLGLGMFHGDEVTPAQQELEWLGLFLHQGAYYIDTARVEFSVAYDAILDDVGDSTGVMVSTQNGDTCHMLLSQHPILGRGSLSSVLLPDSLPLPNDTLRFDFLDRPYFFTAEGVLLTDANTNETMIRNYKLYFHDPSLQTSSLIMARADFIENWVSMLYCGDLDQDQRPDFILNTTSHYNEFAPTLYLSSEADTGESICLIDKRSYVGC